MSKSHAGIGFHLCPICGIKHDEVVLLDKRLQPTLERENFVGFKMCAPHQALHEQGYIALVGAEPGGGNTVNTAKRTGQIMHIKREAFPSIFDCPVPDTPMAFCDPAVIDDLAQYATHIVAPSDDATPPTVH